MKIFARLLVLVVILVAAAYYAFLVPPKPPERQVFINGNVLTMDAENRAVEAVAVERDRIVAVGSRDDVAAFMDGAEVHDLGGKTLIPGFIDAHGHFPGSGLQSVTANLSSPPVGDVTDIEGILEKLKPWAESKAPGEWIVGFSYDDTLLAEKRHPTRDELDRVSTEHPILLIHVSGHLGVANSAALKLAGFSEDTPDPEGGVIVRDPATGALTGLLEEDALFPIQIQALDFSTTEVLSILRFAVDDYASQGITTAQSGALDEKMLRGLLSASRFNQVPFRLELWPEYRLMGDKVLTGEVDLESLNTDLARTKTIKIVADGSIQGFTGFLSHPYHTPFRGDEHYKGYPIFPREKLAQIVTSLHEAGYQMAIHGNGDGAIDDIIYAFNEAQKIRPEEDPRLILIHAQMARDDQLDEMKRLGITPSFFSAHTYYWGDRHRDIFMGPERAFRMSPAQSALQRELPFTIHLDTPVVPMQPMLLVWSAVNRLSTSGQVIGEEQRITPMQALRATTIDAAWQIFQEQERGSIEVGKLADLVVLDGDPLTNPEAIKDIQVDQTLVGGVTIFERSQ